MLHPLKHYLIHRLKSIHLHGIHSPFIFEFNRDCLQDDSDDAAFKDLVRFRESVLNNPQELHIEDHGAGSKKLQAGTRITSEILKHNCSSMARTKLLYRVASYFKVNRTLELGTSLGIGACALALGSREITSIEGSPEIFVYAQQRFKENGIGNVDLVQGTFKAFFEEKLVVKPSGVYDLVFIDGHHDGTATLGYFEMLLPYCHEDSVIIIDDIHWSKSMTEAWKKLIKHPEITASINTFQWGILFLRKQQRQQAFYINL